MNNDRIERAIEGLLSEKEWQALQTEIVVDAELRAAYVERVWLHALLRAGRDSLVELLDEPVRMPAPKRWPVALWAGSAAACVTLAASFFLLPQRRDKAAVATLIQADHCKWAGSDLPTTVNSQLGPGTLSLVEGMATLKFASGATVTIEAPTKLEIRDAMNCRLLEGSLVADVPEPAHGFTVLTPDLKVVDLGTRFGVTAAAVGSSQVRVFEGEVEVGGMSGGAPTRLKEGKGLNFDTGGTAAGQEPSRGAQPVRESGGWTAIPSSFGRGKDATVRRGDLGAPFGGNPLILVKHTDLTASWKNERRGFLTFDVSQAGAARVREAQLVLDPEPSGLGFSALVPDSRFAVYGITDDALDGWNEITLRWEESPACTDEGLVPDKTRKLAEFSIPRGGVSGSITINGEALAEFVRNDANGLVTFIIVRETGETDPSGLVHAFASREHPTANPPTLRLK